MSADRPTQLLHIARDIVSRTLDFHVTKGPGLGDHATNGFMRELRAEAKATFGRDLSEFKVRVGTAWAADFYFPEEATLVEVALGLPNPASEFEKDILKAIMAQDSGHAVRRLLFISRAGAVRKCAQPGRAALIEWAAQKHALSIEVHELGGEPRRRMR